jgi:flagellar biosynthesis protein FliP
MTRAWSRSLPIAFLLAVVLLIIFASPVSAAPLEIPDLGIRPAAGPQESLQTMQVLLLLTVLSIAPAVLILTTAFTRIVVVLGFLRTAMGTQQLPPNQVLLGLALFLTAAVMAPTMGKINDAAIQPYMQGELTQSEAVEAAAVPLKEFMMRQTREQDLALMLEITRSPAPEGPESVPFLAVVPAFAISELKTAFTMGFLLFLPFVIIDFIAASTLMSMGMMMVPPVMVSLPFKILLFVLVDGWHLVVKSLFDSFQM